MFMCREKKSMFGQKCQNKYILVTTNFEFSVVVTKRIKRCGALDFESSLCSLGL